jgi:hypothetical protein
MLKRAVWIDRRPIVLDMIESRLGTIEQVREVLAGTVDLAVTVPTEEAKRRHSTHAFNVSLHTTERPLRSKTCDLNGSIIVNHALALSGGSTIRSGPSRLDDWCAIRSGRPADSLELPRSAEAV